MNKKVNGDLQPNVNTTIKWSKEDRQLKNHTCNSNINDKVKNGWDVATLALGSQSRL